MPGPHRFILQPYHNPASRFKCPLCLHRNKTFKRYIDQQTGECLANHVGRCDREEKCGYHYTPRQYFAQNPYDVRIQPVTTVKAMPVKQVFNHLPAALVTQSMVEKAYIHNNFIVFLAGMFSWDTALQAAERYKIGTSKHWHGATVFWQADTKGRVRTGKIMLYNKTTCKRVKQPFNHIAWVHSLVGRGQLAVASGQLGEQLPVHSGQLAAGSCKTIAEPANCPPPTANFLLQQCFFGEHLLLDGAKATVAITESEKTAVMASIMMPGFIWLAAGSLHGLNVDKCQALQNRTVLLFPDVGAYGTWHDRARTLNLKIPTATFTVHDEMERTATAGERATGEDMGDRWIAGWMGIT